MQNKLPPIDILTYIHLRALRSKLAIFPNISTDDTQTIGKVTTRANITKLCHIGIHHTAELISFLFRSAREVC